MRHARTKHKSLAEAVEPVLGDLAGAAVTIWERWWQILTGVQASDLVAWAVLSLVSSRS